jgi:hypothetical protein
MPVEHDMHKRAAGTPSGRYLRQLLNPGDPAAGQPEHQARRLQQQKQEHKATWLQQQGSPELLLQHTPAASQVLVPP